MFNLRKTESFYDANSAFSRAKRFHDASYSRRRPRWFSSVQNGDFQDNHHTVRLWFLNLHHDSHAIACIAIRELRYLAIRRLNQAVLHPILRGQAMILMGVFFGRVSLIQRNRIVARSPFLIPESYSQTRLHPHAVPLWKNTIRIQPTTSATAMRMRSCELNAEGRG